MARVLSRKVRLQPGLDVVRSGVSGGVQKGVCPPSFENAGRVLPSPELGWHHHVILLPAGLRKSGEASVLELQLQRP